MAKKQRREQASKGYNPKERYGSSGYGFHAFGPARRNRSRSEQNRRAIREFDE